MTDDELKDLIRDLIEGSIETDALGISENLDVDDDLSDEELDDIVQRGCALWDSATVTVSWDD